MAEDASLARALWSVHGWDAPTVSAAVVAPTGTLAMVGDGHHRFALASVTKLLLALASLVAVEEGTLDLDEPAGPPGATVRHLLAHTSGIGFDGGIVASPGARRVYSNAGFDLLGEHLARMAEMTAADYVDAAVLKPLAMTATDVHEGPLSSGATSSVADVARLARELVAPTLIAPATLAAATDVAFPGLDGVLPGFGTQRPNDWGLGFERRSHKKPHWTGTTNSPATFGHFGSAGTFLWVDPAIDRALVVLTDRPFGPWAAAAWPLLSDAIVNPST
jgi:CubicO group peptidase (beta-lactamase class C family)